MAKVDREDDSTAVARGYYTSVKTSRAAPVRKCEASFYPRQRSHPTLSGVVWEIWPDSNSLASNCDAERVWRTSTEHYWILIPTLWVQLKRRQQEGAITEYFHHLWYGLMYPLAKICQGSMIAFCRLQPLEIRIWITMLRLGVSRGVFFITTPAYGGNDKVFLSE
jgi:hypothetical protein